MRIRPAAVLPVLALAAALAGCAQFTSGASPTTPVSQPLDAQVRITDHAQRLADGVARYRDATGGRMPLTMRDLALQIAPDGQPCFTEVLKDHWFQPYAYSVTSEAAGTFSLVSAGANGALGDGDDLRIDRGPGDPRVRTYGYTPHVGG
jgi:hypothetical protein